MNTTKSSVTRLRPLHTRSYGLSKTGEDAGTLCHWTSTLKLNSDHSLITRAFLNVVARLLVLSPGDSYSVHDEIRQGYFHVLIPGIGATHTDTGLAFEFVEYTTGEEVETDFSVGQGKVSDTAERIQHHDINMVARRCSFIFLHQGMP